MAVPFQAEHEIQVFRAAVGIAAQLEKEAPPHRQGLVAVRQAEEPAAPIDAPGNNAESRQVRRQGKDKRARGKFRVYGQPAERVQMRGSDPRVGVEEDQEFPPGGQGAGIHLVAPAPTAGQSLHVRKTGRHLKRAVGAAAVRQDDFHILGGRKASKKFP